MYVRHKDGCRILNQNNIKKKREQRQFEWDWVRKREKGHEKDDAITSSILVMWRMNFYLSILFMGIEMVLTGY